MSILIQLLKINIQRTDTTHCDHFVSFSGRLTHSSAEHGITSSNCIFHRFKGQSDDFQSYCLHIIFFLILMSTFINLDRYAFLPPYANVHSIYHGDAWCHYSKMECKSLTYPKLRTWKIDPIQKEKKENQPEKSTQQIQQI